MGTIQCLHATLSRHASILAVWPIELINYPLERTLSPDSQHIGAGNASGNNRIAMGKEGSSFPFRFRFYIGVECIDACLVVPHIGHLCSVYGGTVADGSSYPSCACGVYYSGNSGVEVRAAGLASLYFACGG